jgi:hypothetical protein
MKKFGHAAVISSFCAAVVLGADPALTIYNQNFAVIRETLPLDWKAGNNVVRFSDATAQVEPSSVILRDPAGRNALQVVEQNYRNDPVSQERLLGLYEGKTIDFYLGRRGPADYRGGRQAAVHAAGAAAFSGAGRRYDS